MNDHLQATVTVLALINPAISAAIFAKVESGRATNAMAGAATKASIVILVVLVGAALVGTRVLSAFGISLDVFQVAGGVVLAWMGFGMLKGNHSQTTPTNDETDAEPSITPLVLFAASPGTITGVITLSIVHTGSQLPVTALVGVAVAVTVTWLVLLITAWLSGKGSGGSSGLMHDLTSRFMGLIVLAMGFQFALSGLRAFASSG
jgi:multiple antibiotic resistance protein